MDIDNPNNINNIYKEKDNYTITGNNKLENNLNYLQQEILIIKILQEIIIIQ